MSNKDYKQAVAETEQRIQEKRENNAPFTEIDAELSYLSLLKRYKKVVPRG